jgi:hypothetical protein
MGLHWKKILISIFLGMKLNIKKTGFRTGRCPVEENAKKETREDGEWSDRKLCVDENCIGVIGIDGRCKECGKTFISVVENEPSNESDPALDFQKPSPLSSVGEENESELSEPDQYWEKRTLCIDENCIGVIGIDGRCKECGKSAT